MSLKIDLNKMKKGIKLFFVVLIVEVRGIININLFYWFFCVRKFKD